MLNERVGDGYWRLFLLDLNMSVEKNYNIVSDPNAFISLLHGMNTRPQKNLYWGA